MAISAQILNVLDAMVTADVIKSRVYQQVGKANVVMDNVTTPAAVMYCVSKWDIAIRSGVTREEATIGVGFVDRQPQLDFDGGMNDAIVAFCRAKAVDFVSRVRALNTMTIIDDVVKCTTVFDEYDTNVTGVWVEFRIKENGGECLDTLQP